MPYVTIDGLRTFYEREGREGSRPLLMVHGASQDTLSWRYSIGFFAEHFDVVAIDLPGHGKSALGPNNGALAGTHENAAHVLKLAHALGLERPIIMGHSMGGGVASAAAAREPAYVGGLVLVDGTVYNAAQTTGYHSSTLLDLAGIATNDWFTVNFGALIGSATDAARGREIVTESRRCIPEVAHADIRNFAAYRLADDLPKIACPVVIVEGDEDWSVPPEPARQAAAQLAVPSEFLLFEGVGHFPQSEQPELFNGRTLDAMRRLGLLEG